MYTITEQQVNHICRLINQIVSKPIFSIIGGYHGVNLGDIALGESVRIVLKKLGYTSGLQTIYNLDKWPWPQTEYSIIGGGAVGYSSPLLKVLKKVHQKYDKLAFLGVDFNETTYDPKIIEMLSLCNWISCRSKLQADRLKEMTYRQDINVHPDLVFSMLPSYCREFRDFSKEKTLLVNVIPLYSKIENNIFISDKSYNSEMPRLNNNYKSLLNSYKYIVRSIVEQALDEGYQVETIPFTPEDKQAAHILLHNLPVKHNKYNEDILFTLKKIGRAKRVFATRYHATIMSIKTGAEIIPMAYAMKNVSLIEEMGVKRDDFLSILNIESKTNDIPKYIKVANNRVSHLEESALNSIEMCISKLLGKNI